MGWLDRLKALTGRKNKAAPVVVFPRAIGNPPRKGTAELLKAYREIPTLRSVVEKIADNVASVRWEIRNKRTGVSLERHALLDLLEDPNPHQTGRAFMKLLQAHLDVVGEAFVCLIKAGGNIVGLWPIAPHWITSLPDFERAPNEQFYTLTAGRKIPASEIIHLRALDLYDPQSRGSGIGFTLGDELDSDEYAARFVKSCFFNQMAPSAILAIEGAAIRENDPAVKAFKEALLKEHQGVDRAGKLLILGGKMSFARLDTAFKDMQLVELREFVHRFVRMAYGIPPEILGDVSNSNRATAQAAAEILAAQVIVPRLEFWRTELQKRLVPQFGDGLALGYANPTPADREHQLRVMQTMPEAFSYDEWRGLGGFLPDPNRQGYPLPMPGQTAPVEAPALPAEAPTDPDVSPPQMEGGAP